MKGIQGKVQTKAHRVHFEHVNRCPTYVMFEEVRENLNSQVVPPFGPG